jgi:hypothetical protein
MISPSHLSCAQSIAIGDPAGAMSQLPSSRPSTSLPSQDVLDYSTGHPAFRDAPRDTYTGIAGTSGSSNGGAYAVVARASGVRKKVPMRPSMELRCKKLDTSLLQVRSCTVPELNRRAVLCASLA